MFDSTTYVPAETYSMTIQEALDKGATEIPETVTAQQHQNLLELKKMWKTIRKDQVIYRLKDWVEEGEKDCGTVACLGGWCAVKGMFGFSLDTDGSVQVRIVVPLDMYEHAELSVGSYYMFYPRFMHGLGYHNDVIIGTNSLDDYDAAMARIDVMLQVPVV